MALLNSVPIDSCRLDVAYATKSDIKTRAIEQAFSSACFAAKHALYPGQEGKMIIDFWFFGGGGSGVNDQPFGWQEIIKGANNRANEAEQEAIDFGCRLVVAVENGLVEMVANGNDYYMDVAWIVLKDLKTGRQYAASSTSVPFPSTAVHAAQRRGFATTTVGQVLSESNSVVNSQDPHHCLLAGVLDRAEILQQAVLSCIGQWLYDIKMSNLHA